MERFSSNRFEREEMVFWEVKLRGGSERGSVSGREGGEGLDGMKLGAVAVWAGSATAQGSDADEGCPEMLAHGAACVEADGPVEL